MLLKQICSKFEWWVQMIFVRKIHRIYLQLYIILIMKGKLSLLQDELQLLIVARVIRKKWWMRFKRKSYECQEEATNPKEGYVTRSRLVADVVFMVYRNRSLVDAAHFLSHKSFFFLLIRRLIPRIKRLIADQAAVDARIFLLHI